MTTDNDSSLKNRLMNAGLGLVEDDFAYHATDLYVVAKSGVREWLVTNYKYYTNVQSFMSQKGSNWNGAGKQCFDIPFAGVWGDKSNLPTADNQ